MTSSWRLDEVNEVYAKAHMEVGSEPHWYLQALGIDPNLQGKGIGTELLNFVAALANEDRVPVFAEACGRGNENFYTRKGGFEVKARLFPRARMVPRGQQNFDCEGGVVALVRPVGAELVKPRQTEPASVFTGEEK